MRGSGSRQLLRGRISLLCPGEERLTCTRCFLASQWVPPPESSSPRTRPLAWPSHNDTFSCVRLFSTTPSPRKKQASKQSRQKSASSEPTSASESSSGKQKDQSGGDDPFDLSQLTTAIGHATEHLKTELSKLRSGGQLSTDVLESLKVRLKKGKDMVQLREVAGVMTRGRIVLVKVWEKDHLKPVQSALISSSHGLNPQPSAKDELELQIPLPSPTAESRKQVLDRAAKVGETAQLAVRNARQAHQKRLRQMELSRRFRPDCMRMAGRDMEKEVEKGVAEVKRVLEGAKKMLEGAGQ